MARGGGRYFMSDVKKNNKYKGKKAGALQRADQSSVERGMRKLNSTKQKGPCNSLNSIQRAMGSQRRV